MIRVASGWSPSGRISYGDRFEKSFDRYWPAAVELQVYVEKVYPMRRAAERSLWDCEGATEFAERHADNLELSGMLPTALWKPKDHAKGYNFRFDAFKFFRQILIPRQAAKGLAEGDILIWLDGDVETIAPVDTNAIEAMLANADVAFLNRGDKHSEIGWWSIRINPRTLQFLDDMAALYTSDEFLKLKEHHSAFIWDHARRMGRSMREWHLSPPGASGHVWPKTILARWTRHDKGSRKP